MKKLISFLLVVALVAGLATTAFAAGDASLVSGKTTVEIGESEKIAVSFSVSITNNTGFGNGKVVVSPKTEGAVTAVNTKGGIFADGASNVVGGKGLANVAFSENYTGNGKLFAVTVEVPAVAGEYVFTMAPSGFRTQAGEKLNIGGATYTVVVAAPETEAPTTEAPTTEAPTTEAPTTEAPTTEAPTTEAPTTEAPTEEPTKAPTEKPTEKPTEAPTEEPTKAPTEKPTEAPTEEPTEEPTEAPTTKPTEPPYNDTTEPDLDDVPKTGDIAMMYSFGFVAIFCVLAAAFVALKSKAVK